MILKDLINKSYYGTIGHVSKEKDLEILNQYILHNFEILKEYKNIIVATNYSFSFFSSSNLQDKNKELWLKYFPNAIIIDSPLNRGHNHGYTDLDNLIFNYCKENQIQWLCKSANDILLTQDIFNIKIIESDFYYLNGISYKDLYLSNFDYKELFIKRLFPQTNFYFINVNKVDFLNDKDYLDETYIKIQQIPYYNGKIWEYIDGWACELFLKNCVERNNLNKMYLLDETTHNKLCDIIKKDQIGDPSHKNIMINGICHYHYTNNLITKI
jgi:hypothetical protein